MNSEWMRLLLVFLTGIGVGLGVCVLHGNRRGSRKLTAWVPPRQGEGA